jgi:hypothetical protein
MLDEKFDLVNILKLVQIEGGDVIDLDEDDQLEDRPDDQPDVESEKHEQFDTER